MHHNSVYSSARSFEAVTPSNSTLVTCNALYVGTGGNVAVAPTATAAAFTFLNVLDGTFLPIELISGRVMATNTTAANIIALSW
jgi:hypothetical protein